MINFIDLQLIYESAKGNLSAVKMLVEHGANIHALGDSAIQWAEANCHLDVVKYLNEIFI